MNRRSAFSLLFAPLVARLLPKKRTLAREDLNKYLQLLNDTAQAAVVRNDFAAYMRAMNQRDVGLLGGDKWRIGKTKNPPLPYRFRIAESDRIAT